MSFHLRPVSDDDSSSPSPTTPVPNMSRARRPLSPTSLRDVDLPHDTDLPSRKYPAPPTGHDLMSFFPPPPPDMRPGPTSGYFQRQERAFFAQAGKEIVQFRVEIDHVPQSQQTQPISSSSDSDVHLLHNPIAASGYQHHQQPQHDSPIGPGKPRTRDPGPSRPWSHSAVPSPSSHHHPSSPPQSSVHPPVPFSHPHSRQQPRGHPPPVPPPPSTALYPPVQSSSQPPPLPAQPPLQSHPTIGIRTPPEDGSGSTTSTSASASSSTTTAKVEYNAEDDDESWRRPMPYNERRRAGKHTRRVVVRN